MNISIPKQVGETETSLFYGVENHQLILFVRGEGTMDNGPALQTFMAELLAIGSIEINHVFMDLSACTYMDSTFIGILLLINRRLKNTDSKALLIADANEYSRSVLLKTGLNRYLDFEQTSIPGTLEKIPISQVTLSQLEKAKLYYEAHHELCEINEANQKEFSFVVQLLKQEYERLKQKHEQ